MTNFSYVLILLVSIMSFSQENNKLNENQIFDIELSYGPQYNFFVDYGRDFKIEDGIILPFTSFTGEFNFYQKRALGTYFNASFSLRLGGRNYLEIGHSRTLNRGTFNGGILFSNETEVSLDDFQLSHRTHFYSLAYKRAFDKNSRYIVSIGISHATFQQSEIIISPAANFVAIDERNNENYNLSEGFVNLGFQYNIYREGNFDIGIKTKTYFVASAGFELEVWSLAPTLKYHF